MMNRQHVVSAMNNICSALREMDRLGLLDENHDPKYAALHGMILHAGDDLKRLALSEGIEVPDHDEA